MISSTTNLKTIDTNEIAMTNVGQYSIASLHQLSTLIGTVGNADNQTTIKNVQWTWLKMFYMIKNKA